MFEIIKAALQTGTAAIIAVLSTMVTNKILAVFLGTSGMGLFSVLNQLRMTTISLAGLGGGTALVQGIAAKENNDRNRYIITVFWLYVISSLVAVILLITSAPLLAQFLTGQNPPDAVIVQLIRWQSVPVFLGMLYGYLSGILTGFQSITSLSLTKAIGPVVMALLSFPLVQQIAGGSTDAFIWLMSVGTVAQVVVGLWGIHRVGVLSQFKQNLVQLWGLIDKAAIAHFFAIAGTIFITGQLGNIVKFVLNGLITQQGTFSDTGIFNAAWYISTNYIILIWNSFNAYYLPKLSNLTEPVERRMVVNNVWIIVLASSTFAITTLIVLKPLLVELLYSNEFVSSITVLRWMFIGDYFKISAYVLLTIAIAAADMRTALVTEIGKWVIFLTGSVATLLLSGLLEGTGVAFAVAYVWYFLYFLRYTEKQERFVFRGKLRHAWGIGLCVVLGASISTWNRMDVDWGLAFIWIGLATVSALYMLGFRNVATSLRILKIRRINE